MKCIASVLVLCLSLTSCWCQGTIMATVEAMSGQNEIPTNSSMGQAYIFNMDLNPDRTLFYSTSFSALEGNFIAGQIHGPADRQHTGPAIFLLSGDGIDHLFGTTPALTDQQFDDFVHDLWYINIFTTTYPQGEIRGQIIASTVVPKPSTCGLLILGAGMIGWGLKKCSRVR